MHEEDNPKLPDCPEEESPFSDDGDFRAYADDDLPDETSFYLTWSQKHLVQVGELPWREVFGRSLDPSLVPVRRHHHCRRCDRAVVTLKFSSDKKMTFDAEELHFAGSGMWGANLLSQHPRFCEVE